MPIPRPHTPYFLIKIKKKEQRLTKEKKGVLFMAPAETYMGYNVQHGEIVSIGVGASRHFPEARIGDILLIHHFVEDVNENESKAEHLVYDDETYNYYVVTAYSYNGKAVETYGVWNGHKIIPNKQFVFLKPDENKTEYGDGVIDQSLEVNSSGILLFKNWNETRESKEDKMSSLRNEIQSLSKSGVNKPHIQRGILEKEKELELLSGNINKKTYTPFRIAFFNDELSSFFGKHIESDSILYVLNLAAQTKIEFLGVEYIVAKTEYVGLLYE